MNLLDTLIKKSKASSLGHFYILEGPELISFVQNFIYEYYAKVENRNYSTTNLLDYPDVYILGNYLEIGESKPFTVQESESFARFFEFKPVQQLRKFAIITEAHRITPVVANKWLKLLEEPYGNCTIFLLNPRGQKLLDTIHSRAIHLRLPREKNAIDLTQWNEFLVQVKGQSLAEFLETFSRGEKDLEDFLKEVIQWESEQEDQLDAKKALEEWLKTYQEMETFHQPTATKWTLFYSYLNQHVLPRVSR